MRMIYRNYDWSRETRWLAEPNREAGEIVREFLTGERNLIELESGYIVPVEHLDQFLCAAEGRPICVERAVTGEILVRPIGTNESLILTGRTAEVVAGYIDQTPVWMEDRGDMTLRCRLHSIDTGTL
jgi:hypothetical protein